MAKGIPVICEHSEYGIPENSPYRFTVADDDSPLDVEAILQFNDSIYDGKALEHIIASIRGECRRNCRITAGLKDVFAFIGTDR